MNDLDRCFQKLRQVPVQNVIIPSSDVASREEIVESLRQQGWELKDFMSAYITYDKSKGPGHSPKSIRLMKFTHNP